MINCGCSLSVKCLLPPPIAKQFGGQGIIKNMYYTYVLKCFNSKSDKTIFYVGVASNLEERIKEHKSKSTTYTKSFDKIELVYYEACLSKKDAVIRERQLKTGFGRGYLKRRMENYLKSIKQM